MSIQSSENPIKNGISRRSFIQLAVGALSVLPAASGAAAGSFLLPDLATEARADESGASTSLSDASTRIVVVSHKQVGLYVADQSQNGDKPIEGAKVTLTSRYNGIVKELDTTDMGIALFDIEDMSEPRDEMGHYSFNGTIDVVAPGYREFHMALSRVTGGLALSVPTRALEEGRPYPAKVAFEEWDALYTKNSFVSTTENTGAKNIEVEVKNLDEAATLRLCERSSSKVYAETQLSPKDGNASASLSKDFLLKGANDALPVDGEFYMQIETSKAVYEFPIALGVMPGVVESFTSKPQQDLTPLNSPIPTGPSIKVPDYIPMIGGQGLTTWFPTWSIIPVVDPFGYLYIAWQSPRVGYTNDGGTTNPGKWGVHPYNSATTQWNNYKELALNNTDSVFDAITKGAWLSHVKWTAIITAAASLRFEAAAKWDWKTGSFSGNAAALALLEFNIACTEQFAIGPVPFFVAFGLNSNVAIQFVGFGLTTPNALDFSAYEWDYANTGYTLTLNISPYLSLGIGIAGVASIAIKGVVTICFFVGVTETPDPSLSPVHTIVKANGAASVEVQLFLFKWSDDIWSFADTLHDSWKSSAALESASTGNLLDNPGRFSYLPQEGVRMASGISMWQKLMTQATPVTPQDLEATKEVQVSLENLLESSYDKSQVEEIVIDEDHNLIVYPRDPQLLAEFNEAPGIQTALRAPTQLNLTGGVDHVDEELGGFWPTDDFQVLDDVYSDPRAKVVSMLDPTSSQRLEFPFLFRIASVEVNGQMRSRVVYQGIYERSLTSPTSVEFPVDIPGVNRADLYDYDFAITSNPEGTDLYMLIISGKREGDATTPDDAFNNLIFTYVQFHSITGATFAQASFSWSPFDGNVIRGENNAFLCPNITHVSGTAADSLVLFSWLHRFTDHPDKSVASDDAAVVIGGGLVSKHGIAFPNMEGHLRFNQDGSAYDMVAGLGDTDEDGNPYIGFVVRGEKGTATAHLKIVLPGVVGSPSVSDETVHNLVVSHVNALTPWLGHTGFLTSRDGKLLHAFIRPEQSSIIFEEVGPAGFQVNSFGTDRTGTYVYFPQGKEGAGDYEFGQDGEDTQKDVKQYVIIAAKLHKGVFSSPFILAHTTHSMDGITHMRSDDYAMMFITTSITDFNTSAADMYITGVPSVACATLLSVVPVVPLISAGDTAEFLITVRNDGNTYLNGATVRYTDAGDSVLYSYYLRFSEETLQESMWNPPAEPQDGEAILYSPLRDPEDELQVSSYGASFIRPKLAAGAAKMLLNVEDDYELAPGRTAVYKTVLPIPEDWSGERFIRVALLDPTFAGAEEIQADNSPIRLGSVDFVKTHATLLIDNEHALDNDINQDAPVTVTQKGAPAPQPEKKEEPAKRKGMPATGDNSALGAAAALGAAGAAMAAYSARRTALEKDAESEEEADASVKD